MRGSHQRLDEIVALVTRPNRRLHMVVGDQMPCGHESHDEMFVARLSRRMPCLDMVVHDEKYCSRCGRLARHCLL